MLKNPRTKLEKDKTRENSRLWILFLFILLNHNNKELLNTNSLMKFKYKEKEITKLDGNNKDKKLNGLRKPWLIKLKIFAPKPNDQSYKEKLKSCILL